MPITAELHDELERREPDAPSTRVVLPCGLHGSHLRQRVKRTEHVSHTILLLALLLGQDRPKRRHTGP
jgi:hypothetical protein